MPKQLYFLRSARWNGSMATTSSSKNIYPSPSEQQVISVLLQLLLQAKDLIPRISAVPVAEGILPNNIL